MNDNDALAVLDERMRRASLELRGAVDAAIADRPPNTSDAGEASTADDGAARVVSLDDSHPARRLRRRWGLAVAAAVLIAVGVGAVIVLGGDDSDQQPTNPSEQPLLLPERPLSEWSPASAGRSEAPARRPDTMTIYGPPEREDQATGTRVMIWRSDREDLMTSSDTESIEVDGHPATITDEDGALTITIALDNRTVQLMGGGVSRDGMLRIAEAEVRGESIEPLLPEGMVEIGDGAIDSPGRPAAPTLSILYRAGAGAKEVVITQRPGRASEVGLFGLTLLDYALTDTTVRGQDATVMTPGNSGSEGNPMFVQWLEPPGQLVTVAAKKLAESEIMELIEALRPATAGEIDRLLNRYGEPWPSDDDPVRDGAVVVAEGDRGRNHWRVSVTNTRGSFDLFYEDDHGGFGSEASPRPGAKRQMEVHTRDQFDASGRAPVVGVANPAISEVTVETTGQSPLRLDLYRTSKLPRKVIVGFVPEAYIDGDVVGRDKNGNELARVTLEPPPSDEEFGDDDTIETGSSDADSDRSSGTVPTANT